MNDSTTAQVDAPAPLTDAELAAAAEAKAIEDKRFAGETAAANRVARQAEVAAEEEASKQATAAAPPSPPKLLGFLAVSIFEGRMIAFPVMPGFDETEPMTALKARLARPGGWVGHAVVAYNGLVRLEEMGPPPAEVTG